MKIGVLILRRDIEEDSSIVDFSRYIPRIRHQFHTHYISESCAEAQIDAICKDGYDMFLNYMAAKTRDDASTVAAIIRYLEAKDIVLLNGILGQGTRSFRAPVDIYEPKLGHLKGRTWVCLAMEMGLDTMAFTPAQYAASEDFRRENLDAPLADVSWVEEGPLQSILKSTARDVLQSSSNGFVRVEASLNIEPGHIYLEGLLHTPRAFSAEKYNTYEDVVIEKEFPGGHAAFFDMLITSKQIRLGRDHERNQHLAGVYDGFAPRYHAARANTGLSRMQQDLSKDYDFSGTVLDLACGNGEFGAMLHEHGVSAKISGIDVSEGMTRSSYIQDHYEKPLFIGPMDELIMRMADFDHVVCFAAFQFLDPIHLTACLARMFMVAQKSVTAIHEDLSGAYIDNMKKRNGELCSNFNHISTLDEFGVPRGWQQVRKERFPLYDNPNLGETVYGFIIRFEKA